MKIDNKQQLEDVLRELASEIELIGEHAIAARKTSTYHKEVLKELRARINELGREVMSIHAVLRQHGIDIDDNDDINLN